MVILRLRRILRGAKLTPAAHSRQILARQILRPAGLRPDLLQDLEDRSMKMKMKMKMKTSHRNVLADRGSQKRTDANAATASAEAFLPGDQLSLR
jgi:hypothetical protein